MQLFEKYSQICIYESNVSKYSITNVAQTNEKAFGCPINTQTLPCRKNVLLNNKNKNIICARDSTNVRHIHLKQIHKDNKQYLLECSMNSSDFLIFYEFNVKIGSIDSRLISKTET